jgi:hypothetical protein
LAMAVDLELARLRLLDLRSEKDRPKEFHSNDLPLYQIIRDELQTALDEGRSIISLSGKPLRFLLLLVPRYLDTQESLMLAADLAALRNLCEQYGIVGE